MAWEGSDRRATLPPNWGALRAACKAAAGGRCEKRLPSGLRCPRMGTDADHKGDRLDHTNLQWLCPAHHKAKTSLEAAAGKARKGAWIRETLTHPGKRNPS